MRERAAARRAAGLTPSAKTDGATACSASVAFPYKISSTRVATDAIVTCTVDVWYISGTLYLYRSANFTVIGSNSRAGGSPTQPRSSMAWYTSGDCLSSTWQYHGYLVYNVISNQNGAIYPSPILAGPSWISC